MTRSTQVYDVFLSSAHDGDEAAREVREAFESAGLRVYSSREMRESRPGRWEAESWEAMAEAGSFVLLLSPAALQSSWTPFEFGAARGGQKEIYLVCADRAYRSRDLPDYLKRYRPRPLTELNGLVKRVKQSSRPLPDEQRLALSALYSATGATLDELSNRADVLDDLTRKFNKATGCDLTPEHVFQELIRLRKRRQLPRLRRLPAVNQG